MFLLLLLLLLLGVVVALTSTKVASFSKLAQNGSLTCAISAPDETISSSSLKGCSFTCARHDTCIGFNIKHSLTCDVYNYEPSLATPVSGCTFYQVFISCKNITVGLTGM